MVRFVHDVKVDRWVIIAPGRITRPQDNLPAPPRSGDLSCPFEPGSEALNEEVFRIEKPGRLLKKNDSFKESFFSSQWLVRVIKNKYPITDFHEVIIHSPSHEQDIDTFSLDQVELILQTYRARYNYHVAAGHGRVLIFNNHDIHAGASINHPHSQLVVVPKEINLETIAREPVDNIVVDTRHFTVYCPNFSQWPYEVWIAPNKKVSRIAGEQDSRGTTFGTISDGEIADLAVILQKILRFIIKRFSEPGSLRQKGSGEQVPYNYYIYHGPDWYLRIIPRLIHRAGLELGTGLSVNIIDPAKAAEEYRTIKEVSLGSPLDR